MLAELVHHVIGVDPGRDWITLAIVDAHTTGICAHGRFPATARGYVDAVEFVDGHSIDTERAWAVEGTASYGRGLTVALSRRGEWVIEFDRPTRLTKDGAKSDHLDAVRAAEQVERCSHFRDRGVDDDNVERRCTRLALRALARRIDHLNSEIADHDRELKVLL